MEEPRAPDAPWYGFAAATLAAGLAGGLAGAALAKVLHLVQRAAYGYELGPLSLAQSFLEGASAASPARRFAALAVCGALSGGGWWALYRFGRPLVEVEAAVAGGWRAPMPLLETTVHALLQILTVGLGAPLGREVAPRELAAALATKVARRARLQDADLSLLVACAAGGGLAAVYDVPLGGAVFALEGLIGNLRLRAVVPALATSVLATAIARALLGSEPQYAVSHFPSSLSLTVYSILVGPLLGLAGSAFSTAARAARAAAPRDARLLVWCPAVMLGVGVCAIPFPQILGNGEATLQLTFNGPVGWELGICLLILRIACPLATLRAGASGGTLTPSLAIGGALAALLGGPWSRIWPGVPAGAFSIVGAAAFLSATMHPLAAVIITAELARVDVAFLVPTICAVAGSSAVRAITRTR